MSKKYKVETWVKKWGGRINDGLVENQDRMKGKKLQNVPEKKLQSKTSSKTKQNMHIARLWRKGD